MSIVRAPRPQGNFYILDKGISEDKRLTWAARGLLVYLLGKPDHWQVSTAALVNETASSRLQSGRDAVRGLLVELIDAGYITRTVARSDDGKVAGYDYHVSEISASPATANPGPAEPATAAPGPANPRQVSTDSLTRTDEEERIESVPAKAVDADPVEAAFELFWKAGMVKTGRKKALALFAGLVKKNDLDPAAFGEDLAADVKARVGKQYGFDKLHPTTYLNGERWTDELPPSAANDNRRAPANNNLPEDGYARPTIESI